MALAGDSYKIYELVMIIVYAILIITTFYYNPTKIKWNTNINLRDLTITTMGIIMVIALGLLANNLGLISLKINFGVSESLTTIFLLLLIVAPAEEIIFRGFLGNYFLQHFGISISIVLTSIIFGLVHLPKGPILALMSGIGGLFFAFIYFNTSSIINPIIAHTILGFLYFLSI